VPAMFTEICFSFSTFCILIFGPIDDIVLIHMQLCHYNEE
jgi:hypothetical protein